MFFLGRIRISIQPVFWTGPRHPAAYTCVHFSEKENNLAGDVETGHPIEIRATGGCDGLIGWNRLG